MHGDARQRVGRDQHVDLVIDQRTDAAELELLFHVDIDVAQHGQE